MKTYKTTAKETPCHVWRETNYTKWRKGMSCFSSAKDNLLEVSTIEIGRCKKVLLSVHKVDPVCPHVYCETVWPAKQSPVKKG